MSIIIEGYNYDLFISYHQKDNKYDGWVTWFVENLKKEPGVTRSLRFNAESELIWASARYSVEYYFLVPITGYRKN